VQATVRFVVVKSPTPSASAAGGCEVEVCEVRSNQYLNNLIEQDHRAIKRRCAAMGGFKSFGRAAITLARIELARRIRKRHSRSGAVDIGSPKQIWDRALA
jgi:putative transposase